MKVELTPDDLVTLRLVRVEMEQRARCGPTYFNMKTYVEVPPTDERDARLVLECVDRILKQINRSSNPPNDQAHRLARASEHENA